jgi:hypothetical protein
MKKEIKIKKTIFILFFVFFFQILTSSQAVGASLNWENPNKNGNNPYKISTDAILNSGTLMQAVGCTGLVDKVSEYANDFLKKQAEQLLKKIFKKEKVEEAKREGCKMVKKSSTFGTAGIWNTTYSTAFGLTMDCSELYNSTDEKTQQKIDDLKKQTASTKSTEECFNGLAYTLAKNQLTSMTRETINWINTGFNGDPLYVQNITSLTNSIERNVLETGVQELANGAFPFGRDFARSAINSYNTGGIGSNANKNLNNLTSDLSAFITDKDSYGIGTYGPEPKTALQREQDALNTFSNDFSSGGWDGYLALTQRDQNNPLGFTMTASQYLADRMDQQSNEVKDEALMGGGFLSQKKCVLWKLYDEDKKPIKKDGKDVFSENKQTKNDACEKYNIVTPGSIIKDKLNTYINSPERQLELADTINEFLNGLFTNLISNFRQEGLAGLSAEKFQYNDESMGLGYGSNNYNNTGLYSSEYSLDSDTGYNRYESFDLTRDLGNTYNHKQTKALGTWNAKTNTPELNISLAPYNASAGEYHSSGVYYIVTTPGNTKLFNNGYNGWATGDRAFWNGKEWQNWKKGQISPIEKRGVIQIQKDYSVATKELLKKLPGIMPKIGELDYCIPGPNENILITSRETSQAFLDLAGSTTGMPDDNEATYTKYYLDNEAYQNYIKYIPQTLIQTIKTLTPVLSLLQFETHGATDESWAIRKLDENISDVAKTINKDIQNFYDAYFSRVIVDFYGKMKSQFITNENTSAITENPKYLPMINAGIAITKNMIQYDEEISSSAENYLGSIVQAEENTVKLTAIKAQVSKIINDAQKRRDSKLLEILREETIKTCNSNYAKCMSSGFGLTPQEVSRQGERGQLCSVKKLACEKKTITEKEYQTKYASCFEEENIHYYDDQEIMNYQGDETLRCSDKLDNDLDGLVDSKDPDCAGGTGGAGSGNGTPNTTIHLSTGSSGVVATTTPSNPQAPSGVGGSLVLKINEEIACDTSGQNGYGYETSDCLSFNYAVYPGDTIKIIATGYQNYYNNSYKVNSIKMTSGNTTYYTYTYKTGDPSLVNHTYQIPYGAPSLYNLSVEFSPK